jgi:dephospho-CoA kinase
MSGHVSRARDPIVLVGGGIGAGKSSVLQVFSEHGFSVISTDDVGRAVLAPRSPAIRDIHRLWPEVVEGGVVNRQALAMIVFGDPDQLERLERITHPEIERRVRADIDRRRGPVAVEVPVMKVLRDDVFTRVAVLADRDVRMARAVTRGATREDVEQRMATQPTDDEWRDWADVVLDNSGAWAHTEESVRSLIAELLSDG